MKHRISLLFVFYLIHLYILLLKNLGIINTTKLLSLISSYIVRPESIENAILNRRTLKTHRDSNKTPPAVILAEVVADKTIGGKFEKLITAKTSVSVCFGPGWSALA